MTILELLLGIVLFVIASYVFWRIGDENAISPRWRHSLGLESLVVFVVLGGWAGGGSLMIRSVMMAFGN
jgi:hypothetical protein